MHEHHKNGRRLVLGLLQREPNGLGRLMGFITDIRTIKRSLNGDMDRDLEIITGPGLLLFRAERGSVAELERAVARRASYEAQLDGRYLRDLYKSMHDGGDLSRAVLNASDMAGISVATGDYEALSEVCAAIDASHWLVRELGGGIATNQGVTR